MQQKLHGQDAVAVAKGALTMWDQESLQIGILTEFAEASGARSAMRRIGFEERQGLHVWRDSPREDRGDPVRALLAGDVGAAKRIAAHALAVDAAERRGEDATREGIGGRPALFGPGEIRSAIERHRGNRAAAARELGVTTSCIARWARRLQVEAYRPPVQDSVVSDIADALRRCRGNVAAVARELGITRRKVQWWARRGGIGIGRTRGVNA